MHTKHQTKSLNRLEQTFNNLRQRSEKALIPFLTAGYPDLETSRLLALQCLASGADLLELGIPCSDALADGPVIQKASQKALSSGTNPEKVFELVAQLRQDTEKPLVLMGYYNQVLQTGEANFLNQMQRAGADALIIPDLPLEESTALREASRARNLCFITMAAPVASTERYKQLAEAGSGFLYCVSVAGVTGVRSSIPPQTLRMLQTLRRLTSLPLSLGFGISSRQQVAEVSPFVDGIIVGSALMEGLEGKSTKGKLNFANSLLNNLKEGLLKPQKSDQL